MGIFLCGQRTPTQRTISRRLSCRNADIYRTEGDDIYETLRGTEPYYFDGPEKYVKETVEFGFGEYGLETRVKGPTTDEFVARVQKEIIAEVGRLLQSNVVPADGVIERP